jgi:hypothetical protein
VKPCFLVLARTGGNPRTTPGSIGVVVAPLLKGVACYAELQSARSVMEIIRRAQRLRGISVFVDPTLSALVSLLFLLCFLLGLLCAVCLSNGFYVVSVVCYINIAGRKSISSTKPFTRVTSTQVHHGNWFWSGNFRFRPSGRSWLSKPVANR